MKKSVLISLIALGVSLVGLVIALAAWMRKKKELCCDDFDDDFVEVECPHCGETVYFDQDMLESDEELICPNCNKPVIPTVQDDEE